MMPEMIDDRIIEAMRNESVDQFVQVLSDIQDITQVLFPDGLTEKGADWRVRDYKGETVVHIAAKYGHPYLLTLFHISCHADINELNARGRCPLSLAALYNKEIAVELLLAFGARVDSTDEEDMTPLHYAVVAHSIPIAQRLLFAGASRSAPFPGSKSPRDIAEYRSWPDLVSLLTEPSCLISLHPCKTPIQPLRNHYWNFVAFHLFFVVRYVLVLLFILPGINWEFLCASVSLCSASLLMYEIVSNTDPGYIDLEGDWEWCVLVSRMKNLLEDNKAERVCAVCAVLMEEGDKHCLYCGKCVRRFDHHCPWLHNCIGARNQRLFSLFIFLLSLDFAYHCVLSALVLLHDFFDPQDIDRILRPLKMAISGLSGIAFLCVFPIFIVQIENVYLNTTTHARFAKKRPSTTGERTDSEADDSAQMLIYSEEPTTFHSLDPIHISGKSRCCGLRKKRRVEDQRH